MEAMRSAGFVVSDSPAGLGAAVVKATLTNASGTAFVIDNDIDLAANQKEQVLSEPLIMQESEILKVQATSGAVDVIASILEINREDR